MGIGGVTTLLVPSVTAKVRNIAPHGSDRWTDAFIRSMIHMADMMLCEQADIIWIHEDIALVQDATYFAVPVDAIRIGAVLFSEDGTTFNDGVLWPVTINELDQTDYKWKNTASTKPTHYFLLSTPGVDGAKIGIYPKMSAVTAEAIRLVYTACRPANNLTLTQAIVPESIEDVYYVPMTLALLYGAFDNEQAAFYYGRATAGLNIARGMYANRYDDVFHQDRPTSTMGGQLG